MDKGQTVEQQKTQSGRQVRLTESGLEYQKENRMKAFDRQSKELKKMTKKITGEDGTLIPNTRKEHLKEWTHCFVNLLQGLTDLRAVLSADQLGQLEKETEQFQTLKIQIQDEIRDRDKKLESTEDRACSVVSRRSRASALSSVRESLDVLQVRDERRKAALRVEQAAVLRRRQIEREKQALKWKEEDLEMKVKFDTMEEQSKALRKFKTEMEEDTTTQTEQIASADNIATSAEQSQQMMPVPSGPTEAAGTPREMLSSQLPSSQHTNIPPGETEASAMVSSAIQDCSAPTGLAEDLSTTEHVRGLNADAVCFQPRNDRTQAQLPTDTETQAQQFTKENRHLTHHPSDNYAVPELSELLAEQRRSRLPALEPEVFRGEVARFHPWMKTFEAFIESRTILPSDRLHYLSRYTGGEAKTVIEGFFLLNSSDAYDRAKKKLIERYGNDFLVANSYRKKLKDWPMIRPGDSKGLRHLADYLDSCLTATAQVAGLASLNEAHENRVILQKLPRYVIDRWKRVVDARVHDPPEGMIPGYPTFSEFVGFLNKEARIACAPVDDRTDDSPPGRKPVGQVGKTNARVFFSSVSTGGTSVGITCKLCSQTHTMENCQEFQKMTLQERREVTRRFGLCRGCLRRGHVAKDCKRKQRCKQCGGLHPTLLHDEAFASRPTASASDASVKVHKATQATSLKVSVDKSERSCSHSMIVPVILHQEDGDEELIVYAILDAQSDACFISEGTLAKLSGNTEEVYLQLSTMAGKTTVKSQRAKGLSVKGFRSSAYIELPPTYSRSEIPAERHLIPRRDMLKRWKHLEHVAEDLPPYLPDAEVGLLLGMNCPRAVRPTEIVPGTGEDPWAIKTELGWSVVGVVQDLPHTSSSHCVLTKESKHCHFALKTQTREVSPLEVARLFDADFTEGAMEKKLSQEDRRFLNIVDENFHQRPDKHFEGPLPLKDNSVTFPNNKHLALKRLYSLKKKFALDAKFKDDYCNFMADSLSKGYAERVPDAELNVEDGKVWYVPHHGVYHAKKGKLRVVYDCSAEFQGFSLNSQLLQGPDYINNLAGVFVRFRKDKIALSCDIEGMFNQIFVCEENRNLLRFLWWENEMNTEPVSYRVTTHLFGAVSSPACAMYALHETAEKYEAKFGKEAADFVRKNFYVDDGLISVSDADSAVQLAQNTISLCAEGGFRLHKFSSNDQSVIERLPADRVSKDTASVDVNLHIYEHALGMKWSTKTDTLHVNADLPDRPLTRRGVLSSVSSLYDPVGLISPVILKGKHFVKALCGDGLSWDEPVPEHIAADWIQWKKDISALTDIAVPRCYVPSTGPNTSKVREYQLHHFSDASTTGYGQASYLRAIDEHGRISSSLVMSKAKVTPKRVVTIPRLELSAAVLSVSVSRFLEKELDIPDLRHYFWTDSKVVLGYISNESRRFHVFIANRVERIRQHTSPQHWNFVSSKENPADLASRGLTAGELRQSILWWHGPQFLTTSEELPEATEYIEVPENDPEVKKNRVLTTTTTEEVQAVAENITLTDSDPEVKKSRVLATTCQPERETHASISERLTRFSSWSRAKMAIAICLRYKQILLHLINRTGQHLPKSGLTLSELPIDSEELLAAERVILNSVQSSRFEDEVASLKSQRPPKEAKSVKKQSDIYRLDPFIGEDGLLRVGGRTRRSDQPLQVVHPVILPKDHHVTEIIIGHFHERTKHSGRGITLAEIRASGFWVIRGRSAVAQYLKSCVNCIKLRGSPCTQKMADLPTERMEQTEPFTFSGCDCFGPFLIKERRSDVKRWGIVFTCLSSRAVHIETLNSMTADSFINAYRRFVCRRGPIRKLMCDNATNFIGGKGYLEASLNEMDRDKIRKSLLAENCDSVEFEHITPKASHMGGSWERQIRTLRSALNRLFQETGHQLDDELLRTVMAEAESVVNSRPLTYVDASDPDSLAPITPN